MPVPDSGIAKFGLDALLVTPIEPVAAPTTVGEKLTVNARDVFGVRVNGVVTDASENPAPEIEMALTVRDAPPVFVSVTVLEADVWTFTFPKLTDAGEPVRVPRADDHTISTAA